MTSGTTDKSLAEDSEAFVALGIVFVEQFSTKRLDRESQPRLRVTLEWVAGKDGIPTDEVLGSHYAKLSGWVRIALREFFVNQSLQIGPHSRGRIEMLKPD